MSEADALRADLRARLSWPAAPPVAGARVLSERREGKAVVEDLALDGAIPGTLIRPDGPGPFPAVLYCHAHGGRYERGRAELLEGAGALLRPWGPELAAEGIVALCVDMPGFGDRQGDGPESAIAKAHLWRGDCLFAAMLRDLAGALGHLATRPEVDPARVFAFGLSMGAAHAMWLGALDARIAGVVQLFMLADMGPLIATGGHDRHGPYLTVPGLLDRAEIGDVAGLVAPKPHFVAHGGRDALTPPAARDAALARLRAAYAGTGDALTLVLDDAAGHGETARTRAATLAFLRAWAHTLTPERIT